MKKLTLEELRERHLQLMEYQEEIYPFTATLREIQDVWKMGSLASVRYTLDKLFELDSVKIRKHNKKQHYYAV